MKNIFKPLVLATGIITLAATAFNVVPVFAGSPGQLEGGSMVYEVKDVTQNGSYGTTVSAAACDVLEYSVELHNTEYGTLTNIVVGATLPSASATSNTSNVTATTALGGTSGTTGTATVNLSTAQSITYTNGSAVLFDANGNVIEKLPDTITTSGVNVGSLVGSTVEYVNFKAQVGGCAPAPVPTYSCNALTLTQTGNTVSASVATTATNGATLTNVSYNFGNGSTPVVSSNSSVSYTYPAVTTNTSYTVTAIPTFNVNGSSKSAGSASCIKTVSIVAPPTTPPVTPVTPTTPVTTTPTALVNTGPGNVIGIFAATSIVGAVAHRLFKSRQFARNSK